MMTTVGYGLGMTRAGAMWFALQVFGTIEDRPDDARVWGSRDGGQRVIGYDELVEAVIAASLPPAGFVGACQPAPLGQRRVFHDDAAAPHEHRRRPDGSLGPAVRQRVGA